MHLHSRRLKKILALELNHVWITNDHFCHPSEPSFFVNAHKRESWLLFDKNTYKREAKNPRRMGSRDEAIVIGEILTNPPN